MQRDIDLFTAKEVNAFTPTKKQVAVKLVLHRNIPERFLSTVTYASLPSLAPYIAPYSEKEVIQWAEEHSEFVEWLLAPDAYEVDLQMAKSKAMSTVQNILDMDPSDLEINAKLLSVQMKAAEFVLKGLEPKKPTSTVNNKLSLYGKLPKHLASKSEEALEAELLKLERAK
jgi:hypothetical protein